MRPPFECLAGIYANEPLDAFCKSGNRTAPRKEFGNERDKAMCLCALIGETLHVPQKSAQSVSGSLV